MIHKDKQDKWFSNDTSQTESVCLGDEPKTLADYDRLMEMEENKRNGATPHKCPICGGRGFVPEWFYNLTTRSSGTNASGEACRACGGRGIIWG